MKNKATDTSQLHAHEEAHVCRAAVCDAVEPACRQHLRPISIDHLHDESLHAKQFKDTEHKPLPLSQEGLKACHATLE
jgi:hypothetical protein